MRIYDTDGILKVGSPANALLQDGSRALTANWDAGSFNIRAETFTSDVATGTAPFTITSTTVVANLNVDQVDGLDLPGTIANILTDHNLANHNSLSITQLGTVTTGVWQGTAIANAYVAGLDQDCLTTSDPTFAAANLGGATNFIDIAAGGVLTMQGSATIDGIGVGNLLDKSATETVSGAWTFTKINDYPVSVRIDGGSGGFRNSVYGAAKIPYYRSERALGSLATPSAVTANSELCFLDVYGYGATAFKRAAYIGVYADGGTFTDTSSPGRIGLFTTPSGTTTAVERLRINNAGNVGANTTDIEAWGSGYSAIEFPRASMAYGTTTSLDLFLSSNAYYDAGWKYKTTDEATQYYQAGGSGVHYFRVAPSGTIDTVMTWITAMMIDNAGNVGIGTTTFGTNATKTLGIGKGVVPTTGATDTIQIYASTDATSECYIMDEAGNATLQTPHPSRFLDAMGKEHPYPWSYYSKNVYLGKEIHVNMSRLVEIVEELSGENIVVVNDIPGLDWDQDQESKRIKREQEIEDAIENKDKPPEMYVKKVKPEWMRNRGQKYKNAGAILGAIKELANRIKILEAKVV